MTFSDEYLKEDFVIILQNGIKIVLPASQILPQGYELLDIVMQILTEKMVRFNTLN